MIRDVWYSIDSIETSVTFSKAAAEPDWCPENMHYCRDSHLSPLVMKRRKENIRKMCEL